MVSGIYRTIIDKKEIYVKFRVDAVRSFFQIRRIGVNPFKNPPCEH